MKKRNSNFELMRIVSMLFIVIGHTLSWGGVTDLSSETLKLLIYIVYALITVHVNSFILLTGYFQLQSKFKSRKVINLLFLMLFYRVFCLFLAWKIGWMQYDGIGSILLKLLPLSNFSYWYLNVYIVLYLLSPYLNIFINNIGKKKYDILLGILFIFCSIVTRVTMQEFLSNEDGYSLIQFIFMYLLGGYLKKYDSQISIKLKKRKIGTNSSAFVYFTIYFILGIIKFLLNYAGEVEKMPFGFLNILFKYSFDRLIYDDPLVILQSIAYFLIFKNIKLNNKFVNLLSKGTNEVYLFHMNKSFRANLYLSLGLNLNFYALKSVSRIFFVVAEIYLIGIFIYFVRKFIFKILSKSLILRKLNQKLENKCGLFDVYINS